MPGSHDVGTVSGSKRVQRLVTKGLPSPIGNYVGLILFKLRTAECNHRGRQILCQLDHEIHITVPSEVGSILVRTLEEDIEIDILSPTGVASKGIAY